MSLMLNSNKEFSEETSLLCVETLEGPVCTKKRRLSIGYYQPCAFQESAVADGGEHSIRSIFLQACGGSEHLSGTFVRALVICEKYIEARGLQLRPRCKRSYNSLLAVVATCCHIAAKFEEVRFYSIPALVSREPFAGRVTAGAVRALEFDIAQALDWRFGCPTPFTTIVDLVDALRWQGVVPEASAALVVEAAEHVVQFAYAESLDVQAGVSDCESFAAAAIISSLEFLGLEKGRALEVMVQDNHKAALTLALLELLYAEDPEPEADPAPLTRSTSIADELRALAPNTPFGSFDGQTLFLDD